MKIINYANQIGYNSAIHGKYNSFHVFLIKLIYEKKTKQHLLSCIKKVANFNSI